MDTPEETNRGFHYAEKVLEHKTYYVIEKKGKYLTNHTNLPFEFEDFWTSNVFEAMLFSNYKRAKEFLNKYVKNGYVRSIDIEVRKI